MNIQDEHEIISDISSKILNIMNKRNMTQEEVFEEITSAIDMMENGPPDGYITGYTADERRDMAIEAQKLK